MNKITKLEIVYLNKFYFIYDHNNIYVFEIYTYAHDS